MEEERHDAAPSPRTSTTPAPPYDSVGEAALHGTASSRRGRTSPRHRALPPRAAGEPSLRCPFSASVLLSGRCTPPMSLRSSPGAPSHLLLQEPSAAVETPSSPCPRSFGPRRGMVIRRTVGMPRRARALHKPQGRPFSLPGLARSHHLAVHQVLPRRCLGKPSAGTRVAARRLVTSAARRRGRKATT